MSINVAVAKRVVQMCDELVADYGSNKINGNQYGMRMSIINRVAASANLPTHSMAITLAEIIRARLAASGHRERVWPIAS